MSLLEKIYDASPLLLQNVFCSLKGYANNYSRYGRTYREERAFLLEFNKWSLEKKREYQCVELKKFITYAAKYSSFYRELYRGIDIDSINSISDLKRLPIVDKEMLREHIDSVVIHGNGKMCEGHTGGTTGKSLVVKYTYDDNMKRMAMLDHFKACVGFENRVMRRATFNGKHIIPLRQTRNVFWRYNSACKQMIFSTFHITESNLGYYVDELNRFKPQALDGFFTSMCDVANYIERHQVKLTFSPIAIFPTSETLTDDGRTLLERVFCCKVYDQYASSEGAPFVTECSEQVKHVELSSGVFEQLDNSNEILVTSFTTHGTPLIRYRIGDCMQFAPDSEICSCGNDSPIVLSIQGRRLDFLYTAEGAKINAGNVANLFKNMPNALIRAQLLQTKMGEVTALLQTDQSLYKLEYDNMLVNEFAHKFGVRTKLTIMHVDSIPRESSGKYKMIINKVDPVHD